MEICKLQRSPIQVTLHSAKTIEQIAAAARNPQQRDEMLPIKVALFKNSMFVVDGHAVMEGFKLANLSTIRAIMYRVESTSDVLALHVKFNQHSPLNPFELIDLINFMIECGEQPEQIRQRLQLREHLAKLIGCHIANKDAKNRLKIFVHDLSLRYSNIVIPPYFVELVSKVPEKIQLDVVEQFIAIISQTLPDRKFAFPGPETLEVYFRQYLKNKEREPVFFRHEATSSQAGKTHTKYSTSPSPKERQEAKEIIGTVPGMAILRVDKPGLYRINMIKNIISPIREEKNLTIIQGDEGRKIFSLPPSAVEFLEIADDSDASDVSVMSFNVPQLRKFVANLSAKNTKFVVMSRS
ncbi:MAG: hypothetical protein ACREAX_03820 [Candidatus Nitrosotenuis sp.]